MKHTSLTHTRPHTRTHLYVLIACEESQAECLAFRQLGHIAYSCDIQPCRPSGNPQWHIQGDVTPYLHGATQFTTQDGTIQSVPNFDLIIAHPPCTYLCKVGSQHLYKEPRDMILHHGKPLYVNRERYEALQRGREFFIECLNADAPYVAVENPIPLRLADLPKPSCFLHPSWFGVKYTKKTLFWLKNLPPIMPTLEYPNPKEFVKSSRGKYRSRTFPQVAQAIAQQWSSYILDDLAKHQQ